MKRILFVYQRLSSFVRFDREILDKEYELVDFEFPLRDPSTGERSYRWIIKRSMQMRKEMKGVEGTYIWFGDIPTAAAVFWARRYGVKSIVVAGGYGAAYMDDVKYGLQKHLVRGRFPKYAFNNADLVLSVSERMREDLLRFTKPRREAIVYNGINTADYRPGPKEDKVLTVGDITELTRWKKGIETFVRAAEHLPDVPFIIVGGAEKDQDIPLKEIASDNVTFTGSVPFDELLHQFQTSKVYVQVSAYESFGYAPAEAMLCHCVPVVTKRGALPEVVGDAGIYVPYGDPRATAKGIEKALRSDLGPKARERILEKFPLEKRRDRILEEVAQVM